MAYDETVAQRIRQAIEGRDGLSERKMFGGLCLMLHGNMFAGLIDDELMLRVGPDKADELLGRPGTRVMDFTGRPMKGYLYVDSSAFKTAQELSDWLGHALSFVEQLPPKAAKKTAKTRRA
jgi:TfoX/Sxy family transcriptional regulator of competence genes